MRYILSSIKLSILCFILIASLHCLTTTPVFQISSKYLETATYSLNTSPFTGNASSDLLSSFSFAVPLLRTHSSYYVTCSISALNFQFTGAREVNVSTFVSSYTASSIALYMYSRRSSKLSALSIRYLIIDAPLNSKMTHFYSGGTYYVQNGGTTNFSSSSPITCNFGVPTINTATATKAIVGFSGLNVSSTDGTNKIDIRYTSYYTNSSTLRVDITTTISQILNLRSLMFWIIGYNIQDAMSWPWPAAKVTVANFQTSSPYSDPGNLIQNYNSFWGITYLTTNNQPSLSFDSSFIVNTSITGVSIDQSFQWVVLLYQVKQCDPTTPYYMKSQDKCYDICPNFYYEDDTNKLCQACTASAYDCLKCAANQTCKTCETATRLLNTNTKRCDPKTGYYDTGSVNASKCDMNCQNCSQTSTNCTSCLKGLFLNVSNMCQPCIPNCDVCANANTCTTCSNNYYFDSSNSACILGVNCSLIADCMTCSPMTGCTQCSTGFSLINSTSCMSICRDGILSPTEQCDIGNLTNGCTSNCSIQPAYFCTGSVGSISTCTKCTANCLNCTSLTSCTLCEDHYEFSANSTCEANCSEITNCLTCSVVSNAVRCSTCTLGYGVDSSYNCVTICGNGVIIGSQTCDDNNTVNGDGCSPTCLIQDGFACTVNNSMSVCVPCLGATYQSPNKTVCLPCANYDCSTCSANGDCLTCNSTQKRYLNTTTNRCLPLDGFYDDGANEAALPCDTQCLTCSSSGNNSCLSCRSNQVLVSNTCNKCSVVNGKSCGSCYKLNSSYICTLCLDGTVLQNGICITQSKNEEGGVNLLLILLPLLLGLLCCCCLILFCIWRRRKNEENKVQEQIEGEIQNTDKKNSKIDENIKIESLNESKDIFDEKTLTTKKSKYRGDNNKSKMKSKKRRAPLPQDTEENELSLEEFKDTLQMRQTQKKNNDNQKDKVEAIHFAPSLPQKDQQTFEKQQFSRGEEKGQQSNIKEPIDDGVKSQVRNQDIIRNQEKSEFSENETQQNEDEQDQERGR